MINGVPIIDIKSINFNECKKVKISFIYNDTTLPKGISLNCIQLLNKKNEIIGINNSSDGQALLKGDKVYCRIINYDGYIDLIKFIFIDFNSFNKYWVLFECDSNKEFIYCGYDKERIDNKTLSFVLQEYYKYQIQNQALQNQVEYWKEKSKDLQKQLKVAKNDEEMLNLEIHELKIKNNRLRGDLRFYKSKEKDIAYEDTKAFKEALDASNKSIYSDYYY